MKAVLVFLSAVRPFNNIMASFGDTPSHYFAFYLFFLRLISWRYQFISKKHVGSVT